MNQKRVTYFSAWRKPQHHIVFEDEVDEYVQQGKDEHYKVVITDVDEDEPTTWKE